jgi:hypothetical protein
MEKEKITIPGIELSWTDWVSWKDIEKEEEHGGVKIDRDPGVYEVRFSDCEDRLTIGKTVNLNKRIRRGLVQGKLFHSSGKLIRVEHKKELEKILIRWAKTNWPSAVEEALHKRHLEKFGKKPEYVRIKVIPNSI